MIQRVDPRARRAVPASGRPSAHGLLLFLVSFLLRAAYAWIATGPNAQPFSDPAEYDTVAWNLASGHGFSLGGAAGTYPTAMPPPLLPWTVSLLYAGIGHHYFAAVLLQCAVGALIPLLLVAFGGAMFGGSVGRLAGWLVAIDPLLVFMSGYLLTEPLFVATLVLSLGLSAEWVKTPRRARGLGAGIAWGIASLARPTALLLPFIVLAWAWIPLGLSVASRERARQMALVLLGLVLVVGPWTVRNAIVFHAFVPVAARSGTALLAGNNPDAWNDPALRGGASHEVWSRMVAGELRGRSELEGQALARERALAFLRQHVADWPAMALAKLGRFWRLSAEGGGTGTWQRPGSPLASWAARLDPWRLWCVVVLPFALWGLALALRGPRRWFQTLSLWVIAYFCVLTVVFWGSLRMRMQVEPLVVLYAAAGMDDARRRLRARARGLRVVQGRP